MIVLIFKNFQLSDKLKKLELPYHFLCATYMPKLNTANPEVKEFLWHMDLLKILISMLRLSDAANEIDHKF